MNAVLITCIIILTLAVVVAVVFLVQTLIQMRRTGSEAEILLKGLNEEMNMVKDLTNNVSSFVTGFGSPWMKFGAWLATVASIMLKKGVGKKNSKNQSQEDKNV